MMLSTDAQRTSNAAGRVAWVQCRSELREVRDGSVACPLDGRASVAECLDCRMLETLADERARFVSCSTLED